MEGHSTSPFGGSHNSNHSGGLNYSGLAGLSSLSIPHNTGAWWDDPADDYMALHNSDTHSTDRPSSPPSWDGRSSSANSVSGKSEEDEKLSKSHKILNWEEEPLANPNKQRCLRGFVCIAASLFMAVVLIIGVWALCSIVKDGRGPVIGGDDSSEQGDVVVLTIPHALPLVEASNNWDVEAGLYNFAGKVTKTGWMVAKAGNKCTYYHVDLSDFIPSINCTEIKVETHTFKKVVNGKVKLDKLDRPVKKQKDHVDSVELTDNEPEDIVHHGKLLRATPNGEEWGPFVGGGVESENDGGNVSTNDDAEADKWIEETSISSNLKMFLYVNDMVDPDWQDPSSIVPEICKHRDCPRMDLFEKWDHKLDDIEGKNLFIGVQNDHPDMDIAFILETRCLATPYIPFGPPL